MQQWRELRAGKPGKRFQERYERQRKSRKTLAARLVWVAIAIVVIGAGIVLLPAPGPGLLVIVVGVALLAQESPRAARWLDRAELLARNLFARRRRRA